MSTLKFGINYKKLKSGINEIVIKNEVLKKKNWPYLLLQIGKRGQTISEVHIINICK